MAIVVHERHVNRNYTVWFRTEGNKLLKWNESFLNIIQHGHENKPEWYADIVTEQGKKFLVYETNLPQSVQSVTRQIMKEYGHQWQRTVYADAISTNISKAESLLERIVSKLSFNKPLGMDVHSAKTQYEYLTKSIEYNLYKNHIDNRQLHTEQYEDYYKHVMQFVAEQTGGIANGKN